MERWSSSLKDFSILFIALALLFFQGFKPAHGSAAITVHNGSSGAGHVEKVGSLDTYVTGSNQSKSAVLLISDVRGYEVPHLRNIADKAARAGFFTVVPDFFNGDPFVAGKYNESDWIKNHGTAKGFEDAEKVIGDLKLKGFTAIGVGGFCWGAKPAIELSKSNFIQAVAIAHPSYVTVDDIKEVKVPIEVLGGEFDLQRCPPALVKQFEEALKAKPNIDSYVKVFSNAMHGFTTKYNDTDTKAVQLAEKAHQDLVAWFTKHVK